jgi:hypothetical protein
VERIGGVRLIILDPIVSAVAGDSHKNAEVRRSLQPVADLAASSGCAVLGITHFSKGTQGRDPTERLTGSLAFGALARIVLVAAKEPNSGDRLLLRAKSNIGPDGGGFRYDLEQIALPRHPELSASVVVWGEQVQGAARELLARADGEVDDRAKQADAADRFLRLILAGGAVPTAEVFAKGEAAGIGERRLQRAADRIGVSKLKGGMRGGWTWHLQRPAPGATANAGGDSTTPEDDTFPEQEVLSSSAPSATGKNLGETPLLPQKSPSTPTKATLPPEETEDDSKNCWGVVSPSTPPPHPGAALAGTFGDNGDLSVGAHAVQSPGPVVLAIPNTPAGIIAAKALKRAGRPAGLRKPHYIARDAEGDVLLCWSPVPPGGMPRLCNALNAAVPGAAVRAVHNAVVPPDKLPLITSEQVEAMVEQLRARAANDPQHGKEVA